VQKPVRFGVTIDRDTDVRFSALAGLERRTKRNMHEVLLRRIVRLWKDNPDVLEQLKLVVPVKD
jgi:hypothetical protein